MRAPVASLVGFLAVLALAVPLAGCGAGEETTADGLPLAVEGEPLEIGGLIYNVSITRFLNPNIVEDSSYLTGADPEPKGMSYLGVFLQIKNDGDDELPSAGSYKVTDASNRVYSPIKLDTPFDLQIGANVPADKQIPAADTVAASGPTQGALLLFLVDDDVSEERPLELEVTSALGKGVIELDI
jgi:hypothetical protein